MAEKNMNAKISVEFEETVNRQQLSSGDNLPTLFGKIKKFFTDLKPVAFSGSYNDLDDIPDIVQADWEVTDETASNFILNKPTFTEIQEEDLPDFFGLSDEELQGLTDVISDNEIRTDKTYSSSRIYEELQKVSAGLFGEDGINFTELSESDITAMLHLSQEQLDGLATVIVDNEIRIDKTYSSSKITEELQKNLNSSRQYTLEQIAQSSGAVYKVVPSIDEMVDAKYIYLLENESVYDLYIYDEDSQTATKVGDTSVNLKGYYTQGESDDLFVRQTDFDTLSDNIGDVNTLTTSEKTIVTAINEAYSTIVSAHTYTTSETVVGTWTDGKPIYRRVIQSNGVHLVNQQEGQLVGIYLIPNMGTVVSQHISFAESYNIDKCCQSIPYTTGDSTPFIISYNANNGYFTAVNANIFAESFDFVFTAIIEYTKTTDNV